MAISAAYLSIERIRDASLASDAKSFANIAATTSSFALSGGWYQISCVGSTFGTATLQVAGTDPTPTWLTAPGVSAFSANSVVVAQLGPGNYRWALA